MSTQRKYHRATSVSGALLLPVAAAILWLAAPAGAAFAEAGQTTFESPEAAVDALLQDLKDRDVDGLAALFGPKSWDEIVGPDKIQAREGLEQIYAAAQIAKTIAPGDNGSMTLIVGAQGWPFPVPLVAEDGKWRFDSEAGIEEILNRRIGANELSAIAVMREYVEAQVSYASDDRDGDEVLEYAQKVVSASGKRDGLYWVSDAPGDESPFGPFVAESARYLEDRKGGDPFKGYYFKVLTRQGENAPGGRYDYVINGNMIAGFAMLAYPAEYGNSGIMSFIVNQQGTVYERDLGEETAASAPAIDAYDPADWAESAD